MQTPNRQDLLSILAHLEPENFETAALAVFRYQASENALYARFLQLLGRAPERVSRLSDIPFLPIGLFKTHQIQSGAWTPEAVFTSSGTTGQQTSRHLVRDLSFYQENTRKGFAAVYGDPSEWCILALLPSYLERSGSSLVAMADYFIRLSAHKQSGFFLNDLDRLRLILEHCRDQSIKTLLLGVSFALLDLAERYPMDLSGITIMETGGMKGRRRELTRSELHNRLRRAFGVRSIHSEYGMTELFSQAYSRPVEEGEAVFVPAATLRPIAMEINDPFCPALANRPGVLHFIDLANLDTCSFIATEDVGMVYEDHSFSVLGRLDAAEMRGCNLMVE